VFGLLTLPWLLGGCAGSLFKTQVAPPTMYLLSADRDVAAAGAVPPGGSAADLAVLKPLVRSGLDTERIAALYPDRHLDYFADARWSGALDEVIQDLAVQLFHSHAGVRNVSNDASAFASTYWLEIEVADFQAEYAVPAAPPTVHVRFVARLGSSSERRIMARWEADARQPAGSNRMSAIVDAYERAANQALTQIAVDSAAALAAAQPPAR
jgi:ABC-type uncharacterized transport system auxiliary subunit